MILMKLKEGVYVQPHFVAHIHQAPNKMMWTATAVLKILSYSRRQMEDHTA